MQRKKTEVKLLIYYLVFYDMQKVFLNLLSRIPCFWNDNFAFVNTLDHFQHNFATNFALTSRINCVIECSLVGPLISSTLDNF